MDSEVLAEAVALRRARRAFALATVVWRRAPSSSRVGAKAIVFPDGKVRGWLGGACAEPTMVREALAALSDGNARLLFLGPPEEVAAHTREGSRAVPMACESEGALEVYIEPFLPVPQLVVVGCSPAVHALAIQARALDWDVIVVDDGGDPAEHPHPELVRVSLDFGDLGIGPESAIVIATQGHYDDVALERALETEASYVGVVAAEKRASVLLEMLRDRGADARQLARVQAPAGLDLGAVTNAEIAVSVLADLVARRAAGGFRPRVPGLRRREANDPVCGMTVFPDIARHHAVHAGHDYWFCAATCQRAFVAEPDAFVGR
jgi:xanthine dehydrogenase accessory factor